MGNNKVKTAKQLQGKKGTGKKDLHPESRRVKQAARVELRTKRVNEASKERQRVEQGKIDHLLWFVKETPADRSRLQIREVHELVERYLARLDEAIAAEQKERRAGRPKSKLQEELEASKTRDAHTYRTEGILMPDLTEEASLTSARYWNTKLEGDAGYLRRLRLVRIIKTQDEPAVVQQGEKLGPKIIDANLEVEETAMEE